jgi:bacterioferritin-associated ferredoxin
MVVCLCSCVMEADIIREIKNGYDSLEKLSSRLNVAAICGSCRSEVEHLLHEHKIDGVSLPKLQFIQITG